MSKALAAFACAVLISALGAVSWHSGQEISVPVREMGNSIGDAGARDEVIYEIEKLHSLWRGHDTGTGCGKGAAGNP